MCANYDYVGSRRDGGFAEYVAVPVWNLIELDDSIPFTSAAMLEPLSVALHAMRLGGIKPGDSVAIVGTGMIGISAAQWAKTMGARCVTIIGRSDAKRQLVERCDIEYVVSANHDAIGLYDVVLEAVGTPYAIGLAIQAAKPGGTLILMGNPSGDILLGQDVYWRILRQQLKIVGTWNSAYDGKNKSDWTEAVSALASGKVNVTVLISHMVRQDCLMDGLTLMKNHTEPYCKVMTIWE